MRKSQLISNYIEGLILKSKKRFRPNSKMLNRTGALIEVPGIELESVPCPNGCPVNDEFLFVGHDRVCGLPGEFPVVRCNTCGLVRTDPRPTADTIGFYYPEDKYWAFLPPRNETKQKVSLVQRSIRFAYLRLIRYNDKIIPNIPPGRMLEIGCASGSFLAEMRAKKWEVEGIESSESIAGRAQAAGFNVFCGSLESAPEPTDPFDLIVGWMVVEHLHEPLSALRKLSRYAAPQGWLAISIPNATNLNLRLFKEKWFALQVPTHLYHFSDDTIVAFLARTGWRVERIFHHRSLDVWANSMSDTLEGYGIHKFLSALPRRLVSGMGRSLAMFPISCLLAALGQTGLITVWAKKNDDPLITET